MLYLLAPYASMLLLLLLIMIVTRRARLKDEKKLVKGLSLYGSARYDLSEGRTDGSVKLVHSFLMAKLDGLEGHQRKKMEEVVQRLESSKGDKKKLATFARQHTPLIKDRYDGYG